MYKAGHCSYIWQADRRVYDIRFYRFSSDEYPHSNCIERASVECGPGYRDLPKFALLVLTNLVL